MERKWSQIMQFGLGNGLKLPRGKKFILGSFFTMEFGVAGQHLNVSHHKSSVWPNPNITIFSGN